MAFRDDLHAARTRAEQLEESNRALASELRAAYVGRFPRRSVRYSVGLTAFCLLGLSTLGIALGVSTLPAAPHPAPPEPLIASTDREPAQPTDPIVGTPQAAEPDPPLGVEDVLKGEGRAVKSGEKLKVHYVGKLTDGTEFDSSRKRGEPFTFTLGKGTVIKGWEQGLEGMRVGGLRRLTIPPGLGYGEHGHPPTIPPSATLIFDVELLAIDG